MVPLANSSVVNLEWQHLFYSKLLPVCSLALRLDPLARIVGRVGAYRIKFWRKSPKLDFRLPCEPLLREENPRAL